jgi:hypothetical protein
MIHGESKRLVCIREYMESNVTLVCLQTHKLPTNCRLAAGTIAELHRQFAEHCKQAHEAAIETKLLA